VLCIPINNIGVEQLIDRVTGYATLTAGTYYYKLNRPKHGQDREVCAIGIQALAGVVITDCTIQDCVFFDLSDFVEDGSWIPETPSQAYVPVTGGFTSSAGITIGTGPGAAIYNVSGFGSCRQRLRVVLSAGGQVRVGDWN
jgi:hypothetical protein